VRQFVALPGAEFTVIVVFKMRDPDEFRLDPASDVARMAERRGRRWARCTAASMPFPPSEWPSEWLAVECEAVALVRDLGADEPMRKALAAVASRSAASLWSELRIEALHAERLGYPIRLRRREPPFKPREDASGE